MSAVFGISGMIGFVAILIGLIIATIRKQSKKQYLIGLAVCFVLFVVGVSLPSDDTENQPAQATNQSGSESIAQNQASKAQSQISSSPSSKDDVIKMDYKSLYKSYDDNPIKADSEYRDKKIQLTGTIASIDRDIGQSPYITFNVDEYGAQSIKMSFDDDETVAALKKGQKVTVVGTCGGTFASVIVVLNHCSIVK